jgi:hypothetical protein
MLPWQPLLLYFENRTRYHRHIFHRLKPCAAFFTRNRSLFMAVCSTVSTSTSLIAPSLFVLRRHVQRWRQRKLGKRNKYGLTSLALNGYMPSNNKRGHLLHKIDCLVATNKKAESERVTTPQTTWSMPRKVHRGKGIRVQESQES